MKSLHEVDSLLKWAGFYNGQAISNVDGPERDRSCSQFSFLCQKTHRTDIGRGSWIEGFLAYIRSDHAMFRLWILPSDFWQELSSLQLVCFVNTGTTEGVLLERKQFLLVGTENRTVIFTESWCSLCNTFQEDQSMFIILFSFKSQYIYKGKHYRIDAVSSFWKTLSEKQILRQESLFHFTNVNVFMIFKIFPYFIKPPL